MTREDPTHIEDNLPDAKLIAIKVADDHFIDIIQFLSIGMAPAEYTTKQRKELVVQATDFLLIARHLHKMGPDEVLHRYAPKHERQGIPTEAGVGVSSGNYAVKATMHNILISGLLWCTVHKDEKDYFHACDVCQRIGN